MPEMSSDKLAYASRAALLAARPQYQSLGGSPELISRHVKGTTIDFYVTDDANLLAKANRIENIRGDRSLPND